MVYEVEGAEVDWPLELADSDVCWGHRRGFTSLQCCVCVFLQMPLVSLSLQRGCYCTTLLCHSLQLWCSNQVGESVVCDHHPFNPPSPPTALCLDFPPHVPLLFLGEMEGFVRKEPLQEG